MPEEVPIACTLTNAELPGRIAAARALGADALVGLEVAERNALLRFRGERERVDALVAAEQQCCAFFDFGLRERRDLVELEIRTPEGGEPILRGLVAAVVAGWEDNAR
ncbi:MAG: hypothetical protein H0V25_04165 [Solirubrobacterales bacterium]|nr:hypothetical protein [Solirubrobacterales bacterium]